MQKNEETNQELERPNYYAILPANVRYDKRLSANAKLLYCEITALANAKGYCYASNNYFSELFSVDTRSVQRWILNLKDYGYITINFENNKDLRTRKIFIVKETDQIKINETIQNTFKAMCYK
jgi:conserved domain protein